MSHKTKPILILFLLLSTTASPMLAAAAFGLGVNVPVTSRVIGGGNTLFVTSLDITNNNTVDTQVDLYFDGVNTKTQAAVVVTAGVTNNGLTGQGGGMVRARSNVHFEDLIDSLSKAGLISSTALADGVLGSVLVVFNNFSKSGQGSVTARISNDLAGGSVGLAIRGRELTGAEPQKLVVALRDTRGNTVGDPEVYPNLFVNHIGLTPAGVATTDPITVEVSAVASTNGAAVGVPVTLTIPSGRVGVVGSVFDALQVPRATNDTILVYARVKTGTAAIQGVVSQVDAVTRDGSAFDMGREDF